MKDYEDIQLVTEQDLVDFKAKKNANLFERHLIDTLEQEWNRTVDPKDITDEHVDIVELCVGMGHGAWDMVDPKEIIAACFNVMNKRSA